MGYVTHLLRQVPTALFHTAKAGISYVRVLMSTEDKASLRFRLRKRRQQLPHRGARQYLINQALSHFPLPSKPRVAVYAALPEEVCVDELVRRVLTAGQLPLYPLVKPPHLQFIACHPSELSTGYMGILEPPENGPRVPLEELHAIIVPGLGFTCEGDRLGYGGGWYDRTLHQLAITHPHIHRIGIGFQIQVQTVLPVERHDIRTTALITEWGWRYCQPTSQGRVLSLQ